MALTVKQRERVATLERRRKFLHDRLPTYTNPRKADYDRAELGALTWVLALVRTADLADVLADLEERSAAR